MQDNNRNRERDSRPRCKECGQQLSVHDHRSVMMSVGHERKCSKCRDSVRSWNAEDLR